jgi:hypothetical protein
MNAMMKISASSNSPSDVPMNEKISRAMNPAMNAEVTRRTRALYSLNEVEKTMSWNMEVETMVRGRQQGDAQPPEELRR